MGRPKLLLPFGRSTVIEQTLSAWRGSRVSRTFVTVHPDDANLAEACRRMGAHVVITVPPPDDMKASVLQALEHLEALEHPSIDDYWLLAPADMPLLTSQVIDRVIEACLAEPSQVVVACRESRHGHPVAFAWHLVEAARQLPPDHGLNQLLAAHRVREIDLGEELSLVDLDTPDDYEASNEANRTQS
jgi:CTP:molybdopterin cytidylyltransferase MocA